MKNITKIFLLGTMLFLILFVVSCSSFAIVSPPQLKLRTLRIDKITLDKFVYHYEKCTKRFLGICTKKELVQDEWLFSDKEKMKELESIGFVLQVEKLP